MSAVVVRPAEPEDFDRVASLTLDAYRADGQLDVDTGGYEDVLADVPARVAAAELLVATDAGEVVGAVSFVLPGSRYAELCEPGEAEFRMLAVDPRAQRRGAGEALVRACVSRAREAGARAIVICTRDFTHGAHRLYQRLGFAWIPEKDLTPIPGVNLLAMRLDLSEPA